MSATGPPEVVLALGSNLGDRVANLQAALGLLVERGVTVARVSSVWETAPIPADQPAFLNAVLVGSTMMAPVELLQAAKEIEHELGRRPSRHWGPRPIDIDILFYDAIEMETMELTIPHPRIRERGFVLAPLGEVVPGPLPVLGERATTLLARLGQEGLRRTGLVLRLGGGRS